MLPAAATVVTLSSVTNCPTCTDHDPKALTSTGTSGTVTWTVSSSWACPLHPAYRVEVTDVDGDVMTLVVRGNSPASVGVEGAEWITNAAEAILIDRDGTDLDRLIETVLSLRTLSLPGGLLA